MTTTKVTYNKIDFFDLVQMFRDHLGIVVRGDQQEDGTYAWDNYDFEPSEDVYPFGQDTHVIVEAWGEEDGLDGEGKFDQYVQRLFRAGKLPTDHPLFVNIWW
jgi:hypothetical protein